VKQGPGRRLPRPGKWTAIILGVLAGLTLIVAASIAYAGYSFSRQYENKILPGAVVRSWIVALRAMAAKGAAVAEALTRRPVRLAAEQVIERLEERAAVFEDEVLRGAAFLTVSRPEPVVARETERLRDELLRRGLRIALQLRVGDDAAAARRAGAGGGAPARRIRAGTVPRPLPRAPTSARPVSR
jgi:hypothetical protein